MSVWEKSRQGVGGEFIERSFEITKFGKENDQSGTKNHFNTTELLQLQAAIDKAISEEIVKTKEETEIEKNNR